MEESQAARPVTMRKQRGFLLWQMAIFMTLSSIVAAYTGQKYWQTTIRESRDDRARLVGTTLAKVTDAVKTYTTAYYQPIQQGQPITVNGYTVPSSRVLTPTLADLNGLGFLPSWATHPIVYNGQSVGFNVAIKIDTSTGCSVPACNLSFQVMTTAPLIDPGNAANVDIRRATIAARTASPGNAGVAMPASFGGDPAIFVTSNGRQIGINPGSVAGLIAMNNNYDSQGFASFLRRDGTLPMTGDLNLKDATGTRHNINNAETVNAQNVNAALDVVAGRDVWATGSVTAEWLHSTKDAQIDRSLTSMGRLYAREYVEVSGWAAQGQGCSPNGLIANSGNGPLFCQSGVWKDPTATAPGTLCGGVAVNGHTGQPAGVAYQPCQGRWFFTEGCPAGFSLTSIFAADAQWFFTCIKI